MATSLFELVQQTKDIAIVLHYCIIMYWMVINTLVVHHTHHALCELVGIMSKK